jgi:release factor glutamine methyltransferase
MQIQQARAHIMATLAGGDSPRADADVLLCHLLGCRRSYLMTWPERTLNAAQQATLQGWLSRRLNGEPIAHLVGEREFWSLPLKVSPATLIPRPDTEVLVEQALARLPPRPASPHQAPCALLDLGTGTGAIALALKSERPDADVWAVDRMPEAAALARANSAALGLPIEVRGGSWFAPLSGAPRFEMIVSNPPYIAAADPHLAALHAEPQAALTPGADGLGALRLLCQDAPGHLRPGAWLLLEHGFDQGAAVRRLLQDAGLRRVTTRVDLAGNERCSAGHWPGD